MCTHCLFCHWFCVKSRRLQRKVLFLIYGVGLQRSLCSDSQDSIHLPLSISVNRDRPLIFGDRFTRGNGPLHFRPVISSARLNYFSHYKVSPRQTQHFDSCTKIWPEYPKGVKTSFANGHEKRTCTNIMHKTSGKTRSTMRPPVHDMKHGKLFYN